MTLRVGVIGTGIMGADHAAILHRDVPGAEVTWLADAERARAEAVGIPGVRVTTDAHDLIDSDDVDAVLIASSDGTHEEYVLACLSARKPVLCEKPLAPTVDACRRIVDAEAALDAQGLLSVGFMRRFDPGYVELRALIESGDLGDPLMVNNSSRSVSAPHGTSTLTITGSAIHEFDIVPWLLGSPVVDVTWLAPRQSPVVTDRQDPQFLLMRTADGVLAPLDLFLNAQYGYDVRCEIVGSRGTASLTEPHRVRRDAGLQRGHAYARDWRLRFADAYRLQNQAWVNSLLAGASTPLATARDGLRAALVADAAVASMRAAEGGAVGPAVPVSAERRTQEGS